MISIARRLNKHFAACAAAAAGAAVMGTAAEAALVHSGPVNIVIPDNLDGLYMNVVTGQTFPPTGGPGFAGYDINPYSALAGGFYLWGPTANTWYNAGGTQYFLAQGTVIGGAAALFGRPGGGTNFVLNGQATLNSDQNLLGFRFVNEANGNQIHHGWIRVQFGANGSDRAIVEYGYEDVAGASIEAGVVPAPGAMALLGLAGLAGTRRRRN